MSLTLNGAEVTIKVKSKLESEIAKYVLSAAISSTLDDSGRFYLKESDFLRVTGKWSKLNVSQSEDAILQIIVRSWEEKIKMEHLFAMVTYIEVDRLKDQLLVEFHPHFVPFALALKQISRQAIVSILEK